MDDAQMKQDLARVLFTPERRITPDDVYMLELD